MAIKSTDKLKDNQVSATPERLKVIIVTYDEPYYIPRYIENILIKLEKDIDVIKVFALPPNLGKNTFIKTVLDYFSYFGLILFLYMVLLRMFYMLNDFIYKIIKNRGHFHSVKLVCKKRGVTFSKIDRINSTAILDELSTLKPDVVFSVASPQIFGKQLISIPSKGCLNIHSSLLPKYRGVNACFWAMAKGEKTTGISIHYINSEIDDGDILLQKKIKLEDNWSLNDLYFKVIDEGPVMIAECLKLLYDGKVTPQKNDISKGSYFAFPAKKDVREFRSRNRRFFKYY